MTSRLAVASALVFMCGCAAEMQQRPAPASLALHGEASGLSYLGSSAGADVGFQAGNCCGAGVFITRTGLAAEDSNDKPTEASIRHATEILEGGVEIMAVVPGLAGNRFRLRIRGAKIGTPPKAPLFGRTGYSGSFAVLFRLTKPDLPATSSAAPSIDLFAGGATWGLGREYSSAGPGLDTFRTGAALVGLRIGADYGIDLK